MGYLVGIADHLGWAVVVTADADHDVVDRRRIELIDATLSSAPIHYDRGRSSDDEVAALVAASRQSIAAVAGTALDTLATDLSEPIESISLRHWPDDFPEDIATQRRPPHEARADAIMYRRELADLAHARDWAVRLYDAKQVVPTAADLLGDEADHILQGPRQRLGPPWTKDHRVALAATVLASSTSA